jgi:hypothetical protein
MASTTEYDLSGRICASLDKHLALAILEFLASRASSGASADAIREAKLAVVEKTYMCDYAVDLYCEARQTKDVRTISRFRRRVSLAVVSVVFFLLPLRRDVSIVIGITYTRKHRQLTRCASRTG